ncbi:MAG: envelope stress response membrane protein PspC [Candidatus Brocadiia bacterium]
MSRQDTERRAGPYRARDGMILGVCKGIADYFGMSAFWVRIIALLILLLSGIWPIVALYLLAALIMKPEPVLPFESEADEEFYNSFTSSREMALHRLKRTFDRLDRRIRRMESIVTSREREWRRRLEQ